MSKSSRPANEESSRTTLSSCARAVFCRPRSSGAWELISRLNTERLSLSRVLSLGVLGGALLVAEVDGACAQGDRKGAPGIDSAVRSGQFEQAAAVLKRAAEAGNAEAQYELASL